MKSAFCLSFVLFFANAFAGDTLIRAQVYNFSIGDTFDYSVSFIQYERGQNTQVNNLGYERCIVSNIYWSLDSSTKYIVRNWVYPQPQKIDTLILANPFFYELFNDSAGINSV